MTCSRCRSSLPLDHFYPRRRGGFYSYCRACWRDIRRERRLRAYGITEDEVTALREAQGHRCAICRSDSPLVVDHDHTTNAVRGLLCNACNVGLGMFRDSTDALLAAVTYLQGRAP